MGMAVGKHMKANDEMTVFKRYLTGALKDTVEEGQKTVVMHLDRAKAICKARDAKQVTGVGKLGGG
jgi:hypothetical protein